MTNADLIVRTLRAAGVRHARAKAMREALEADHPVVIEAAIDAGPYGETVYV